MWVCQNALRKFLSSSEIEKWQTFLAIIPSCQFADLRRTSQNAYKLAQLYLRASFVLSLSLRKRLTMETAVLHIPDIILVLKSSHLQIHDAAVALCGFAKMLCESFSLPLI